MTARESSRFWRAFQQKKWIFDAKVKIDVISTYCGVDGLSNYVRSVWGLKKILPSNFFIEEKYIDQQYFIRSDQVDILVDLTEKHPEKMLRNYIQKNYKYFKAIVGQARKISKEKLANKSNQYLINRFKVFIKRYTEAMALVTAPVFFEQAWEYLLDQLPKEKLIFPARDTIVAQEKMAILKLAIQKNKISHLDFIKRLQELIKKYRWSGLVFFEGRINTVNDYLKRINEALKHHPNKQLSLILKGQKRRIRERDKLFKLLKISNKQKKIIYLASEISYIRAHRFELAALAIYYLEPLIKQICARLNIQRSQFIYLTPPEIIESLQKKQLLVNRQIIKRRQNNYGAYMNDKKWPVVIVGSLLRYLRNKNNLNKYKKVLEVSGTVASRGVVCGRARVLRSITEKNKFLKNEILITQATTPDWVPIMEKASAIVTDLGGLTSHAAIMSRELEVPCVINTRIGTVVFKTGDLVEVNANRGIIRIIKKA